MEAVNQRNQPVEPVVSKLKVRKKDGHNSHRVFSRFLDRIIMINDSDISVDNFDITIKNNNVHGLKVFF